MCLISGFKNLVTVGGESVPIRTDFRIWLLVNEILSSEAQAKDKIISVLGLVYSKLPNSFFEAVSAAMKFYAAGKDGVSCARDIRVFDFKHDGELILAAFRQQYGINLLKENMHWHEFLALLSALGEDTMFIKVTRLRSMDLSKIKDAERRRALARLKKAYALPVSEKEKRENDELILSLKKR